MDARETGIFIAILAGIFILMVLIIFLVYTIIRYQKRKMALHNERIKGEINALERERERIASDLHDNVEATLSAIKLRLQYLQPDDPQEQELISNSEHYIDEAMSKLRRISFNMVPKMKRNGLPDALNELVEMFTAATPVKINYTCTVSHINNEKSIHIYRIVQEILSNVIHHAKAGLVNFEIQKKRNNIHILINDNGVGFDKNAIMNNSAVQGLHNIMARIDLLKAKIYLTTGRGKGVNYCIEIPD